MNFNHKTENLSESIGLTQEQVKEVDDFFIKHQGSDISLSELFEDASKQLNESQVVFVAYRAGEIVSRSQTLAWLMGTVKNVFGEKGLTALADGLIESTPNS